MGSSSSAVEQKRSSTEGGTGYKTIQMRNAAGNATTIASNYAWRDDNGHNGQQSHQQGDHSHRQFQCSRGKFWPGYFKVFCGVRARFDEQVIDAEFESVSSTPVGHGAGNYGAKSHWRQSIAKPIACFRDKFPCLDAARGTNA